jgi:hypothetical protein
VAAAEVCAGAGWLAVGDEAPDVPLAAEPQPAISTAAAKANSTDRVIAVVLVCRSGSPAGPPVAYNDAVTARLVARVERR